MRDGKARGVFPSCSIQYGKNFWGIEKLWLSGRPASIVNAWS
jgi:hypothetical protein